MKINEAAPGFWAGFKSQFKKQDSGPPKRANFADKSDLVKRVGAANKAAQSPQGKIIPAGTNSDPTAVPAYQRSAEIKQSIAANQAAQRQRNQAVAPSTYSAAANAVGKGNAVGLLSKPGVTTPADLAAAATTSAMKPGNTQVPPTKGNMVTTIDAGPRKFYMDRQGQWLEYLGNNWPNDLLTNTTVQRVSPGDVDKLSALIAQGKIKPKQVNATSKGPATPNQKRR